jgi:hypothetical protein
MTIDGAADRPSGSGPETEHASWTRDGSSARNVGYCCYVDRFCRTLAALLAQD